MKTVRPAVPCIVFCSALIAAVGVALVLQAGSGVFSQQTVATRQDSKSAEEVTSDSLDTFELVRALDDENTDVRLSAIRTLTAMGPDAKPATLSLIHALEDENAEIRDSAVKALAVIDAEVSVAVPHLKYCLKDERPYVRRAAADALGAIGPESKAVVPDLVQILTDEDKLARHSAIAALAEIGRNAMVALPALNEAMKSEDSLIRVFAARAIFRLGKTDDALPVLVEGLQDEDLDVRRSAVETLAEIGPDAGSAVSALSEAMKREDSLIRVLAARAIFRLGKTDDALRVLVEGLQNEDLDVRRSAVKTLAEIGPEAGSAVPALSEALGTELHDLVVNALTRICSDNKVIDLLLREGLQSDDASIRILNARGLIIAGQTEVAVPALIKELHDERFGYIAAHGLGEAGSTAMPAVPALAEMLDHADEQTSEYFAAIRALTAIAQDLQDEMAGMSVRGLNEAIAILTPVESIPLSRAYVSPPAVPAVGRCLEAMRAERASRLWYRIEKFTEGAVLYCRDQRWPWVVIAYAGLFLLCYASLFVWPIGLLRINEFLWQLPTQITLKWPFEMTISYVPHISM